MNYSNRTINSDLSIHDSRVVENAVKNAIRAVVDIIYKVNNGTIREYKTMLDDRDVEISRLELRLKQTEDELLFCKVNTNTFTTNCVYSGTNEQEVEFPCVGAKMSPLVFSLSQDGMAAEPFNQEDPEQQMSHSDSSQTGITACLSLARLGTSPVVKDEPPAVEIKSEMCEQGCDQHIDRLKTRNSKRKVMNAEKQRQYRERCRSTPEGVQMLKEKARLSYYKKRVLVSQMSEEAKRQKRAKWRAAQQRSRDRKMFQEELSQATSHFVQADHSHPHHLFDNTAKPEGVGAKMSPLGFSLSQDGMAVEPSNQEDPEHQMSHSSQTGITDCLSLARLGKVMNAENQRQYRERCRSTPEGVQMLKEKARLSYYKKRVLVSQMSEEAKRQKRAKWRAAQQRSRDRKMFQEGLSQATSHFVQADHSHPHHLSDNTAKPEGSTPHRGRPRLGGQVEVVV